MSVIDRVEWRVLACAMILVLGLMGQVMAAEPQTLAGSEWRPVEVKGKPVSQSADLFIRFEAAGHVAGHGGCNRLFGSYTADKVNLRFGPLASTRKGCQPDVMSLEAAFSGALHDTRLYLRDGTKLTLKTAQGETTLRLVQTDWD